MTYNWVVRPVRWGDGDALFRLALAMGAGMTTFPADRDALEEKIAASVASFEGCRTPFDAQYLLVLEDLRSGELLGTAALYASVGQPFGFFSYKRIRLVQRSKALDVSCDAELLTLANDYTGTTEVGTLAVRPDLKGTGAGRLLARSRYMLIATRPELFAPTVMAEMRGWQDEYGASPFWDSVGAHFFNMDFPTADRVSAVRGADFIAELLPKHPIYIDLLPEAARAVIGKPHRSSAPAMAMLRSEGFRYEGYVDVFDAGPQMHVERDSITTVRNCRRAGLASRPASPAAPTSNYLISVDDLAGFRVTTALASFHDGEIALDPAIAAALDLSSDTMVRACPMAYGEVSGTAAAPLPPYAAAAGISCPL